MTEPAISYFGLGIVFFAPALGGLLYGYDIGATSFVLANLIGNIGSSSESHHQQHHQHHHHYYRNGTFEYYDNYNDSISNNPCWWHNFYQQHARQGLTIAASSLGALVGSHLVLFYLTTTTGKSSQKRSTNSDTTTTWSRRGELRAAAVLYIVGTMLNICSGTILRHSLLFGWSSLLVGRFLFGMGVGFVMHGAPTYLSEMSPTKIRGAVVSAKETIIVLGILLGYTIGSNSKLWVHLYYISLVCLALPFLIVTYIIPRSHRWLILNGHYDEALISMQFMYKDSVQQHFDDLVRIIHQTQQSNNSIITNVSISGTRSTSGCISLLKSTLWSPVHRPALKAATALVFFQQASGQPSILSFAPVMLHAAGLNGNTTVLTAVLMIIASSLAVTLVDRVGRRPLLQTCAAVMLAALLLLSTTMWGWENGAVRDLSSWQQYTILVGLLTYIAGYQLGFGPLTWLVVAEIFPGSIRGPATALCVELNYIGNFILQCLVPIIQNNLGWGPTLAIFAISLLFALIFLSNPNSIPETSQRSLEEIEQSIKQSSGVCKNDIDESDLCTEANEETYLVKYITSYA